MEATELTTTITSKTAILRIMHGIYAQNTPLSICHEVTSESRQFLSSISKIDEENNQLVLHQISPEKTGDWQEIIKLSQQVKITGYLQLGAIKFMGHLSPLDDSEIIRYCRLSLPTQIDKTQMRSGFRVAMGKFDSEASILLDQGAEVYGRCRDLSVAGALFHFPINEDQIKLGYTVEQLQLRIGECLELSCNAKVCHVQSGAKDKNLLVGLNFQNLKPSQVDAIQTAIIKFERLNITK